VVTIAVVRDGPGIRLETRPVGGVRR
jgi:hypothetical protein